MTSVSTPKKQMLLLLISANLSFETALAKPSTISESISAAKQDRTTFYRSIPRKEAALAQSNKTRQTHLSRKQQIKIRTLIRQQIMAGTSTESIPSRAPIFGESANATHDNPHDLFTYQGDYVETLEDMEQRNLLTASLVKKPWSDDYWPIYRGNLGARYADPEYIFGTWQEAHEYVTQHPARDIVASKDTQAISLLSPSEKYDLIVSSDSTPLTDALWKQGKLYHDEHGEVEKWMGICHGWAAASYMVDRPQRKITVKAADGTTDITFFPADLRALSSLLWANTRVPTRFVGNRCNDKEVASNENGRIEDNTCFDVNPATWHLSIVNQLGVGQKSFVMDTTFDYEVWNQPTLSYRYHYFHPKTMQEYPTLAEAKMDYSEWEDDPYATFRSPEVKSVVGIGMEVRYLVENFPIQSDLADPSTDDRTASVTYIYDLELDAGGKIIGGEWYQEAHPDFLWTPTAEANPISLGDYYLFGARQWQGEAPLSDRWQQAASLSAQRAQPLSILLRSLFTISNSEENIHDK